MPDNYAIKRADEFWERRINEKRKKQNDIVREAREVDRQKQAVELQLLELNRRAQRLRSDYSFASLLLSEDESTWAAMKAGRHPLGQR